MPPGTANGSAAPMPVQLLQCSMLDRMPCQRHRTPLWSEGLPGVPASKVTGTVSSPAPLNPMTLADEGGDELADSDVITFTPGSFGII